MKKRKRKAKRYGRSYSLALCDKCKLSYKADTVRPYTVYGWQGSIFGQTLLFCEECAVSLGLKKPKPKGFPKGKKKNYVKPDPPIARPYSLTPRVKSRKANSRRFKA